MRIRLFFQIILVSTLSLWPTVTNGQSIEDRISASFSQDQSADLVYHFDQQESMVPATIYGFHSSNQYRGMTAEQSARRFLSSKPALFDIDWQIVDIRVRNIIDNDDRAHVQFTQYIDDTRVYNADYTVSLLKENNRIYYVHGMLYARRQRMPAVIDRQGAIDLIRSKYSLSETVEFDVENVLLPNPTSFNAGFIVQHDSYRALIDAVAASIVSEQSENEGRGSWISEEDLLFTSKTPVSLKRKNSSNGRFFQSFGYPNNWMVPQGNVYPKTDKTSNATTVSLTNLIGSQTELESAELVTYDGLWFATSLSSGNPVPQIDATSTFKYVENFMSGAECESVEGSLSTEATANIDCSHFSAVNVYYHANKFYNNYLNGTLGWSQPWKIDLKVNSTTLDGSASASYKPLIPIFALNFNLADFEGELDDETLPGGQVDDAGDLGNPAKSDDVIYHEYMHLVSLEQGFSQGSGSETKAIFEALSDYFSGSYLNDPKFGEGWVECSGKNLSATTNVCSGIEFGYLRTLSTTVSEFNYDNFGSIDFNTCQYQEYHFVESTIICKSRIMSPKTAPHMNGVILGSTFWDMRTEFGKSDVDQLIYNVIGSINNSEETFLSVLNALLSELAANPTMYPSIDSDALRVIFANRGILEQSYSADFVVPLGSELNIQNKTLLFASGTRFKVLGKAVLSNVTLKAQTSVWGGVYATGTFHSNWSTIQDVSSGYANGAVSCVSCSMSMFNTDVIVASGAPNYAFSNSTAVMNCPYIDGGKLESPDFEAVWTQGSAGCVQIVNTNIFSGNNKNVVIASSSSDLQFSFPPIRDDGGNQLTGKGLKAQSGATIDAGSSSTVGGDNQFCRDTGSVTLTATGSGSHIFADYNFFPGGSAPVETETSGGIVTYSSNQGASSCVLAKGGALVGNVNAPVGPPSFARQLRNAAKSGNTASFLALLAQSSAADHQTDAARVMSELRFAYKKSESPSFRSNIARFVSKFSTPEYPEKLLLAQMALMDGESGVAEIMFADLASASPSQQIRNQAILELSTIYLVAGSSDTAESTLDSFVVNNDDDAQAKATMLAFVNQSRGTSTSASGSSKAGFSQDQDPNRGGADVFSVTAYPNPFNPLTTIQLTLVESTPVKMTVFDLLGRSIQVLVSGNLAAGEHSFRFDASNRPSGLYFVRTEVRGSVRTTPIMLLK